jgi:hypothetical protein
MSLAVKWLLRTCPNLLIMVAGAWLTFLAVWLDINFGGCSICIWVGRQTALEAFFDDVHRIAGPLVQVAAVTGCLVVIAGLWRMVSQRMTAIKWLLRTYGNALLVVTGTGLTFFGVWFDYNLRLHPRPSWGNYYRSPLEEAFDDVCRWGGPLTYMALVTGSMLVIVGISRMVSQRTTAGD